MTAIAGRISRSAQLEPMPRGPIGDCTQGNWDRDADQPRGQVHFDVTPPVYNDASGMRLRPADRPAASGAATLLVVPSLATNLVECLGSYTRVLVKRLWSLLGAVFVGVFLNPSIK